MSDNIHILGDWLHDRALADPHKIAIDDRGVTITYGMLDERIKNLAQHLLDAGYRNGDRIGTVAGNSIDLVVVFFACARTGLVLAPLSWRLTATELAELLRRSQASLLLTEDEFATLATEALKHATLEIPVVELGSEGIETHVPQAVARQEATAWRTVADDDPLLLIFTSGSEAAPKGALLSHKNCFWTNLSLGRASNFSADDVALCMLPLFHVGGWNIYLLLGLWMGATCVLERTFNPARVLRLIETRGITAIMGVPTQYVMMAKDPLFDDIKLASLRVAQVGGAPAPAEIITAWHKRDVELAPAYGLTEASPNVLYTPAGDPHDGMISYPHVNVRIGGTTVDDAVGELQVQGPGVFLGYDADEQRTAAAFTDDGWLRTGDLAERSNRGGIRIVGRSKDIYISGGENVAPAEVERVLMRHHYVDEAAVVGIPDPVWGEVGCAFVVLTPQGVHAQRAAEKPAALAVELRTHAAKSLAAYKVPAHIKTLAALPRISIDKVDRRQLTAQAVAFSEGVQVL